MCANTFVGSQGGKSGGGGGGEKKESADGWMDFGIREGAEEELLVV